LNLSSIGGIQGDYEFIEFSRRALEKIPLSLMQIFKVSLDGLQQTLAFLPVPKIRSHWQPQVAHLTHNSKELRPVPKPHGFGTMAGGHRDYTSSSQLL
jgi:hypothetical protein